MIKYLNEAVDSSWAKRIKENNPNAYAILYGWQYKNEPEVEIAPEVYMDKSSLDKRLNQIVKDYSVYSQIGPRGNRYAKESDILFYILYPSSLGESKNNVVTSNKIGYRNHEYYGANETGLDSIIRYEIGELGNSDIIDTVLDTFEVSTEEKRILETALDILEDEEYLGDTALDLVVKTLLAIIWKKYPNARYGLWLCETPDAVERWYDGNRDNILTYRIENEQPISDLGFNDQGCLFVYDKPVGNYNNKIEALREDLIVDRVAIFGSNDKKLEDVCKKFKNKIRVVRDACEDINGFLARYLYEEGYTDVYTIRGMFKVDTFDWIDLKDFSSKELYQIRKTYGNSSKRSLLKYVESLPTDIQKEFYYIPHTWCELPGGIIIDAAWKMFEPYIEGELSKSHYYHFDQIEDITVYSGYTVKTMHDRKMYGKDYLGIRRKITESQSKQHNSKVYKLDDITKRQVQRNPLYSKYRVEVVELEPLVTQLMKNTSILGRRTDNWGDSFDKFHIKNNKAYWYNDPIRLVKLDDDEYKVLDGNHRLIALYNDGWKQVECLVKDSAAVKEAYHFGNLEYGRKADKRGIMAGRGTGHFGTGFYTIGSVTDDTDYNGRELWEIDLTKYNLFKPRSNNAGYTLHDTLKKLNGLFYQYKYSGYTPNMFKLKPYDLRIKLDDFEYEYGNEGIIKFIDSYFPAYRETIDREINTGRWGAAEQVAYDSIEDFEDFVDDLDFVVNQLELIFPKEIGKVESIVWSLIKDNELDDQDNVDSISTLFIKKMGYEGVDVTHLNKEEDGLSGLDNFSYGSVVYDLKPGTYRKIRDKKK